MAHGESVRVACSESVGSAAQGGAWNLGHKLPGDSPML